MMMFSTMFQFTLGGSFGVKAVAVVVFMILLLGMLGACVFGMWDRTEATKAPTVTDLSSQHSEKSSDSAQYRLGERAAPPRRNEEASGGTKQSWIQRHLSSGEVHVHDSEGYIIKFGWLASRFAAVNGGSSLAG
jgi:hypothetical protein